MGNGSSSARLITRVVVYYRRPGEDKEHQITVESTKGGGAITGLAWDTPLVEKIVYRENGKYVDPKKGQDPGNWKVTTSESARTSEATGTMQAATLSTADATTAETDAADAAALSITDSDPFGCVWVHNDSCGWDKQCSDS